MKNLISTTFAVSATKEGKDAYILDLTNQMNSIAVDVNGKVIYATTLTTVARIIKGADYVREDIGLPTASLLKIEDVVPTISNVGGLVTIEWIIAAGKTLSSERYRKSIQMTHGGNTYSADYVVRTDRSGATYDLKPSMTDIPFVRDANYNLIPASQTVYCGYTKNQNGTISSYGGKTAAELDNIDGKYYIFYRYVNNGGTFTSWSRMSGVSGYGLSVGNSTSYAAVEFCISSSASSPADNNIIDRETVPIVKQSERGYGIVTSVTRNNFTEAQWATYGATGHSETWTDTSGIRNNARVGDLFTVVGQATDTGNGHTAIYRCTNASGNLAGTCIGHTISKAGESPFIVDLSNEADLIGTDSSGKTTEAQVRTTKLKMFIGSKQQTLTSDPTVVLTYASSGAAVPTSVAKATNLSGKNTNEGTVSITVYSGQTVTDAIYADITAACASGSKTARFTMKALKAGTDAELLQLNLDYDALSFSRKNDNTLSPDRITLHAYVDKTIGNTTTKHTSALSGYKVYFGYDNGSAQDNGDVGRSFSISNSAAESHTQVWVELRSSKDNYASWIDRETVPIVKDGTHGGPGVPGGDGNGIKSVTLHRMFTMVFAAPAANDSGWISESSGSYPTETGLSKTSRYLWQKKTTTYTKSSSTTTEISLVAQLDTGIQENLLEDTAFLSLGQMEAWEKVATGSIISNMVGAHNGFGTISNLNGVSYQDILRQVVYGTNKEKLQPNTWYTLSFYARILGGGKLNTYLYRSDNGVAVQASASVPWFVDGKMFTSAGTLSDGTEVGFSQDGRVSWQLSSDVVRHSVTFKTPSTLTSGSTYYVLFRMVEHLKMVYISMPKLEENTIATEWIEHYNDRMADDMQHIYTGLWRASTTGDASTNYLYALGVRHVVRAIESASGKMTFFRMRQRTTSAGYCSQTQPYQDTNHWERADYLKFVAADLILSEEIITDKLTVTKIHSANDTFVVDEKGNVTCNTGTFTNVTISGTLKGVTGTFKSLQCLDNKGNVVGEISFDSNGRLWFSGDMYHQGYDSAKGRSFRFYASDIWCRGAFGARERTIVEVTGRTAKYYDKGTDQTPTSLALSSATYNNETYYKIPCYGQSGDYAGMPVDIVVFKINVGTVYRYELGMTETQRVLVVNANDDNNNVYIYSHGNKVKFGGGQLAEVVKLPSFATPTQGTSILGRGLFVGTISDNNW